MNYFLRFVNWLLPPELRNPELDEGRWFRARILITSCICAIIVQLFMMYLELPYVGFSSPTAINHYVISFLLLLPLTMRFHNISVESVTSTVLVGLFCAISAFIYTEDSVNISTLVWLPVIVMGSYFLNSGSLTYFFVFISIALHGTIFYLWSQGSLEFEEPNRTLMLSRLLADIAGSMIMSTMISYFNQQSNRMIHDRLIESRMEIVRRKEQLAHSAKMVALGEMAGGIAHEINNPLMIIAGRSEQLTMLANQLPELEREKFLNIAESIESTTQRIARIITSMRVFARDTSDEPFTKANLNAIINDALALCGERFKNSDIRVITMVDENIIIHCHPIQISQIMVNLLSNSFYSVKDLPTRWIRISTDSKQDEIQILFEDSGPGIPEQFHSKLFQPFFTTKDAGIGTGLGLSLSLGIAQQHGGNLTYDFNAPVCRFILHLPRKPASSDA